MIPQSGRFVQIAGVGRLRIWCNGLMYKKTTLSFREASSIIIGHGIGAVLPVS